MNKLRKTPEKITIETLGEKFRSVGCKLLTTSYKNNRQTVEYIAKCGHRTSINVMNFLYGKGILCKKCTPRRKHRKTISIGQLRNIFKQKGCKVLDKQFNGFLVPINYICKCGHTNHIELYRFERGQGIYCPKCSGSCKKNIEEVRAIFSNRGCRLLSNEYKWNRQKVQYIAKCGHKHKIKASAFFCGEGTLCPRCQSVENGKMARKFSDSDLKKLLEDNGCTLLRASNSLDTKMLYIASCGHIEEYAPMYFLQGYGRVCKRCYTKINSIGEKIIKTTLNELGIAYKCQYTIRHNNMHSQRLDFFLPQYKTAIEYNGIQHYKREHFFHRNTRKCTSWENQQKRDRTKREWCRENGIKLIEIDGRNWSHEELLNGKFSDYITDVCKTEGWINVKLTKKRS